MTHSVPMKAPLGKRRELSYAQEPQRSRGQAQRGGDVTVQAPRVSPVLAGRPDSVSVLRVRTRDVAQYVWRSDLPVSSSPRPFLHPVRTLGGHVVTDAVPDSHTHQLGIGIAAPDIDGVNFWGGRTFVAGHGPAWLDNHGSQHHQRWLRRTSNELAHTVHWIGMDQTTLLREERVITCRPVSETAWSLGIRTRLVNTTDRPLTVRSPAALGRVGAGYGGFFWRGPNVTEATVLSPGGNGVASVHGQTADWVAVTGTPRDGGPWTMLFVPGDEITAQDRWFVRARDYIGVGSCLAWEQPLVLAPGESIARHIVTVVVDGAVTAATAEELARSAL